MSLKELIVVLSFVVILSFALGYGIGSNKTAMKLKQIADENSIVELQSVAYRIERIP
jgi:hypothetical protein